MKLIPKKDREILSDAETFKMRSWLWLPLLIIPAVVLITFIFFSCSVAIGLDGTGIELVGPLVLTVPLTIVLEGGLLGLPKGIVYINKDIALHYLFSRETKIDLKTANIRYGKFFIVIESKYENKRTHLIEMYKTKRAVAWIDKCLKDREKNQEL